MDFTSLKQKAFMLKDKTLQAGKDAIEYSATKLADSSLTLKSKEDFEVFIQKSKNTSGRDSTTGQEKTYTHRAIAILVDTKSEFFTKMLYALPVLVTKAFSQNMALKLVDKDMKEADFTPYNITEFPALVVFENTKHIKTLQGEENIQKVVKSLSLDINSTIDSL